jgi:hypothetical protein
MHDHKIKQIILCGVFVFAFFTPLQAAETLIKTPVGAKVSSNYSEANYGQQYMIDGSGLTGYGVDAVHTNQNTTKLFWHSANAVVSNQWAEFDLGLECRVTNALIWQLAQSGLTGRGVRQYNIEVAGSNHVFSTYSIGNELARATADPQQPVQIVPLLADNVRYVRIDIRSDWNGAISDYVGLSEVRFEIFSYPTAQSVNTLSPIGATASSYYNGWVSLPPENLINLSGMTGIGRDGVHTNVASWGLWHSETGNVVSAQWVVFDLGARYRIKNALVWQLAQPLANQSKRGTKSFNIDVGTFAGEFQSFSTNNMLGIATGLPNEPVQIVPLEIANTRYVRFDIRSNWGDTDNLVGLSEVQFEVEPEVIDTNWFIRVPVSVTVSSQYPSHQKDHLIDGSGLTGEGLAATHTNGMADTMWASEYGSLVTNEWVTFDLGNEIHLKGAAIWQFNQTETSDLTSRGVKQMTLYTADTTGIFIEYGTVLLDKAGGTVAEPVQFVNLEAEAVRYVKFAVNKNWGYGNMVGLSEVRFLYAKPRGTLISLF